jgi:hypothetical protein
MTSRISVVLKGRWKGWALLPMLGVVGFTAAPVAAAWSLPKGSFFAGSGAVLSTGATTASVGGTVNAGGQATTYNAVYDVASSTWCSSNGASGAPAYSTRAVRLPYVDFYYHGIYIALTGLTAATRYCVAITAYHSSATATGSLVRFKAGAPDARTYSATSTSPTTASVAAAVNPAGQNTTYRVLYDIAGSTWCSSHGTSGTPANSSAPQTLPYTDGTLHNVWTSLTRLVSGTNYCAAIIATNPSASTSGSLTSFTLDVPAVLNYDPSAIGTTTATVNGAVNAFGQANPYYGVVYDFASSTWCATSGITPSPTTVHDVGIAFPYADSLLHPVSVNIGFLQPGTEYCFTIEASNSSGDQTQAAPVSFTTASS